jgi:putative membrane protein
MNLHKIHWLKLALTIQGSVIPTIFNQVWWCGAFGFLVSVLFYFQIPVSFKVLGSVIPSIVLGLLLVFRTNTAYDRFWEGRKAWGSLVNNTRNLARLTWVSIAETEPSHRDNKVQILKQLIAFATATKLHLRSEAVNEELERFLSPDRFAKLQGVNSPPLEIAFWIADDLQLQQEQGRISLYQMNELQSILNGMVDMLGACERILRTPIPLAYAIHLKQLLIIYCFLLPFQLVEDLKWWTGPIVALISFTLFGIEAIGMEIENPFGKDPNDLPLDTICATIERNINDLVDTAPHYHRDRFSQQRMDDSMN